VFLGRGKVNNFIPIIICRKNADLIIIFIVIIIAIILILFVLK
jgi:hypothetical protein